MEKNFLFFAVVPSPFGSILTAIKGILYQEIWHLNVVLSPHKKNSQKTGFLVLLVKVTVIFSNAKNPRSGFLCIEHKTERAAQKKNLIINAFDSLLHFLQKLPHIFFQEAKSNKFWSFLPNLQIFCQFQFKLDSEGHIFQEKYGILQLQDGPVRGKNT